MSRIGGRNTTPEIQLRRALHAIGVRGWRLHARELPGKPDIIFRKAQIAVFVDGAFWHGHPSKYAPGRLPVWWEDKIKANRKRDRAANRLLKKMGWRVVRIWDLDLRRDAKSAAMRVWQLLRET